ncbi:hypothetical protein FRC0290_01944 [Corynebacterium diphtheriae]|nr:hypothetical protein FRC0290_01944 [Corynebacterium diphtheriae]CAB0860879.1 hypothetical protein FRC0326_02036 [Corynebacterium diphtheriae]CAB0872853.1 hypothetical protein FRC0355_02058 [Corynebacterium diphtheriae]CAB0886303.1 hypothetical protein FRC0408_01927 [Corynebacterium diphtheriae]
MSSLSSLGYNLLSLVEEIFESFVTFFENLLGLDPTIPF